MNKMAREMHEPQGEFQGKKCMNHKDRWIPNSNHPIQANKPWL